MGGFGSGRQPNGKVQTVESALKIDIHAVRRAMHKARSPICSIAWSLGVKSYVGIAVLLANRLIVMVGSQCLSAAVTYRKARLGGITASCLCASCARSCTTLFVSSGRLECRRCACLTYETQRLCIKDRAYLKMQKILARLGGSDGLTVPPRPAGMWRKTYVRLLRQIATEYRAAFDGG